MRSLIACMLMASLSLAGCSAVPLLYRTAGAEGRQEGTGSQGGAGASVRDAAGRIPVGAKITVVDRSGRELKGRLRAVNEKGILFEGPGRYPPPPVEMPYDTLQSIEWHKGLHWAAWVAIAAAAAILVTYVAWPRG